MKEPTFETTVNGNTVTCDSNLKGFKIFKKASSNVGYFATLKEGGQLFMQFNNGKCYVYSEVPKETLEVLESADSIGKAYYAFIKGKYPEQAVGDNCIIEKVEPVEDDEDKYDCFYEDDIEG